MKWTVWKTEYYKIEVEAKTETEADKKAFEIHADKWEQLPLQLEDVKIVLNEDL